MYLGECLTHITPGILFLFIIPIIILMLTSVSEPPSLVNNGRKYLKDALLCYVLPYLGPHRPWHFVKMFFSLKKKVVLYSAASSPLDCSKRFTLFALPDRPVHSDTNSASPGSILVMQQLSATTKSLTCPPLSIARYSFIQLSQQGRQWRERKCPIFDTVAKKGFEPGLTWLRVGHSTTELPRSTHPLSLHLLCSVAMPQCKDWLCFRHACPGLNSNWLSLSTIQSSFDDSFSWFQDVIN